MRGFGVLLLLLFVHSAQAVQVVTPETVQKLELDLRHELKVFKDPSLFLAALEEFRSGGRDWDMLAEESPILTTVVGPTCLVRLAPETPFKNFGVISTLYRIADARLATQTDETGQTRSPMIVPVQLCGATAYSDTLGFVLVEDLAAAQRDDRGGLPPSIGNPEFAHGAEGGRSALTRRP